MMTRAIRVTMIPLACLALLTVGSRQGQSQVKNDGPPRIVPPIPDVALPVPVAPRAPAPTVDDLINKLESLRKAKAEIEKQELAVAEQLKERLKNQSERLSMLGIIAVPPAPIDQSAIFGGVPPVFVAPPLKKEAHDKPIVPPASK